MSRYLPGDIVSRRKGLVMHKGVVLEDGRVLHNSPFIGEHISTEAEFRAGKRLHVTRLKQRYRHRALRAAAELEPRGYNLFTNNCEHTAHRTTSGRAKSPQLASWVAGVGVAAIAFAATRHPAAAAAGYALGRKLFGGNSHASSRTR